MVSRHDDQAPEHPAACDSAPSVILHNTVCKLNHTHMSQNVKRLRCMRLTSLDGTALGSTLRCQQCVENTKLPSMHALRQSKHSCRRRSRYAV
jgi:hypothetical protein